ncbi:MAG: sulfatase [Robiginitomaculum sp.]|nr:MAG: sulfatase [Robiginitomaculum sp.]
MNKVILAVFLCVICSCSPIKDGTSMQTDVSPAFEKPNIVFFLYEDMSSKVGAFGDPLAVTPNFDRIANEGVRYTRVFTSAGVCSPSRAALITGRHQMSIASQHMRTVTSAGVTEGRPQSYSAVPPVEVKAFPELLRASGYYTSNDYKTDYQFGDPFTIWDKTAAKADWSGRDANQPFFHMATSLLSHESYLWPTDMKGTSPLEKYIVARNKKWFKDKPPMTNPQDVVVPPYYPDTPEVRRDIAAQYDNIRLADEELGLLYARLEKDGLLENTILIVSTDHGDGLPRAKRSLYDSGLQVPMVVRYPDGWGAGSVNDELISFVDIAPTILSWAGTDIPKWIHGRDFAGPDRDAPNTYIYAAQDRMDNDRNYRRAIRSKDYKYIKNYLPNDTYFEPIPFRDVLPSMRSLWKGHAEGTLPPAAEFLFQPLPDVQLYSLNDDPHEVKNIAGNKSTQSIENSLKHDLEEFIERVGDMSVVQEEEMILNMWPNGKQPVTQTGMATFEKSKTAYLVTLTSETAGASLAYMLDDGEEKWRLYTKPFSLSPASEFQTKAVRYGYRESEVASFTVPKN